MGDAQHAGDRPGQTSRGEWVAAAISGALVAALAGFLAYDAARRPDTPPDLVVAVDSVTAGTASFSVHFHAHNRGHTTAAQVQVAGELRAGDTVVESASATIAYVPGRATRSAGLVFSHDPRRYALRVHPTGYDLP